MTLSFLNPRRTFIVVAIAFAMFSLFCVSDCMRETDQASVLTGAWKLFQGSRIVGEPYYNYDKLYETYWITAIGFWIRSHFGAGWSPVFIGNITSGIVFWSSTIAAVLVLAKTRRRPTALALLCYLSTPAILINSVYTNPAILSAGFLLLSGALLSTSRSLARRSLGAVFFFIAVGARGDAVLLAPLLIWLQLPSYKWVRRAFTGPTTALLVGAIAASTLLGRMLYTKKPLYFDPVFLGTKVFTGYLIFGLGASILLLILVCVVLLNRAVRSATAERAIFYGAGVIALALPLCYYSLQLWSPRYLVTTALGVFLFSASRRGEVLLRFKQWKTSVYPLRLGIGALAILLLLVGFRLSSPIEPHLTFRQPTLFPTADGLHPMGAYAEFLLSIRHVKERAIDHNQLVWRVAQETDYMPAADGVVHVLSTPMRAYLELGIALEGRKSKIEPVRSNYELHGPLYAESRTFMRLGSDQADGLLDHLLVQPARIVSPIYEGTAILRFASDGDPSWGVRTRALDGLFMGNEYRLYDPTVFNSLRTDDRPFVLVGDRPFELALNDRTVKAGLDDRSGLYYLRGDTQQFAKCQLPSDQPGNLTLAVQVLPVWMSVMNR